MKSILLAITGSISFYKAYEILSLLKKAGFDVKIALSKGALSFVNESSFQALSSHPVLSSNTEDWSKNINHIAYSKVDLVILAPASVNTINKLAYGICDDVFMATLIASKAKFLIAPAANTNMLENFATKKAIELLKEQNYTFVEPLTKTLACGDEGKGALAEVETIVEAAKRELYKEEFYKDKKVVISGGATTEKIDEVRAITNFSSGKMAKALADAFYYKGAEVELITSKPSKANYKVSSFTSSQELLSALKASNLKENGLLIMAAAVSDFVIKEEFSGKIKKEEGQEEISFHFKKNIDILQELKELKCKKIGFKLESDKERAKENALKTKEKKALDAISLNILNDEMTFGSDDSKILFISDKEEKLLQGSKKELAKEFTDLAKSLYE